jgi:arylsulfatase A-like enzyme
MVIAPDKRARIRDSPDALLSPRSALLLAAWIGYMGGYIDLIAMILRRKIFGYYYLQGRDFYWTVPLAGLVLVMVVGILVGLANRLRPGLVSHRAAAWLFLTAALWGVLFRLPLHGVAGLLLAAGLGRWTSRAAVLSSSRWPRAARICLLGLSGVTVATAASTTGRYALTDHFAGSSSPQHSPGAKNVLLIVLDTVRAESLSLYGYSRKTSPNLERLASKGVRFDWAIAPAPWSFPSHASFFTGQWPYRLDVHERTILDAPFPTLAEVLTSRGYLTAGFVANTTHCSHETRLNRGFAHYEDYTMSPRSLLATSAAGQWLARKFVDKHDPYSLKWTRFQSLDANGINSAFLAWLSRHETRDRPFFAFLNYFDAHEPFVLPADNLAHFGRHPQTQRDDEFLLKYWELDKHALSEGDATLVRDSYDDCIAQLDGHVGALVDQLERRGVLRDTLVIITSDHGEEFGERGIYDHGSSLYLREIHVPLLILGPGVPEGVTLSEPVSLRELPATIVDLLGLSAGSPFLGRSLADCWRPHSGKVDATRTPALSEGSFPIEFDPRHGRGPSQRGFTLSLVEKGRHFLRDGGGNEELYEIADDPAEAQNGKGQPGRAREIDDSRRSLLKALTDEPGVSSAGKTYLGDFRRLLEAQVAGRPSPASAMPRSPQSPASPGAM